MKHVENRGGRRGEKEIDKEEGKGKRARRKRMRRRRRQRNGETHKLHLVFSFPQTRFEHHNTMPVFVLL